MSPEDEAFIGSMASYQDGREEPVHEVPPYSDQVIRRQLYEVTHPDVEIRYIGPEWEATVPGYPKPFIRYDLRRMMDILEALDEQ